MIYICPICKKNLIHDNDMRYVCENSHSFDISRKGYVNLLLSSKALHGDNKEMVLSRRSFLESGIYDTIVNKLCTCIRDFGRKGILLDCGCGEGYYTGKFSASLPDFEIYGFDISSYAVSLASGRYKAPSFFVASVNEIPIISESVSVAVNIFSPLCITEIYRVLADDGIFIYAIPSENHLFGLKKTVYDKPYKNKLIDTYYEGFNLIDRIKIEYSVSLPFDLAIDLFKMTPYYFNSPSNSIDRIKKQRIIDTDIGFYLLIYKKITG